MRTQQTMTAARAAFLSTTLLWAGQAAAAANCSVQSAATSPPLIELYTSEGCSSCPPADRWLSELLKRQPDSALLAFHVDYWDYIGWKDRFADPRYSARQRTRVNAAGDRTVYTPQVMSGPSIRLNWRDGAVATLAAQPSAAELSMSAQRSDSRVDVELRGRFPAGQPALEVMLALHSDGLSSEIRSGENRGVTLHHDRVVRQLLGPFTPGADGELRIEQSFTLPDEPGRNPGLLAFVQRSDSAQPLQTLALSLTDCSADSPAESRIPPTVDAALAGTF